MEYCPGGELYTYLAKIKKFSIEISRFIAAEVLLGKRLYFLEGSFLMREKYLLHSTIQMFCMFRYGVSS